jgi:uncharacterized protein (DUF433 family)
MTRIEIGKYLAIDSRVCGGKLIFKGSRIKVADALEMLNAGYSPEKIADQYDGIIKPEAVIEAANFIREGIIREIDTNAKTAA